MRYTDADHFREENGYEVEGGWYPRVTKILEIKSKPGLDQFLKEVGNYQSAEDIKTKSAQEGTLVHEIAEKILSKRGVSVPEEIRPAMEALEEFIANRSMLVFPEFLERRIWSERFRYAGTIDALALIDGKAGVLDIKTSLGFYPEFNLQTAAYVAALQELPVRKALDCSFPVVTRWILKINQRSVCNRCEAERRVKGGREKVRENGKRGVCVREGGHEWGAVAGSVELKEFPYNIHKDIRAFLGAKTLWEWEYDYWLRTIGYL